MTLTKEDIDNELHAVSNICRSPHRNIVAVLKFGKLPNSHYHFLDMEFCDFNLDSYILRNWHESVKQKVPYFVEVDNSLRSGTGEIYEILRDITTGVEYIHSHGYVHRDMKPQNSIFFGSQLLKSSFVQLRGRSMEDRRFWFHG